MKSQQKMGHDVYLSNQERETGGEVQPTTGTSPSTFKQHTPPYEEEHRPKNNSRCRSGIFEGRMTPHAPFEVRVNTDDAPPYEEEHYY